MGNSKRNPWELLDRWMKERSRRAVLASRRLAAERDERIRVSAKVIDRRFVSVQPGSGNCVEPQVELPVDTGADGVATLADSLVEFACRFGPDPSERRARASLCVDSPDAQTEFRLLYDHDGGAAALADRRTHDAPVEIGTLTEVLALAIRHGER